MTLTRDGAYVQQTNQVFFDSAPYIRRIECNFCSRALPLSLRNSPAD